MADKLPVDFEKKVKQPPPVDGKGYPYQLSAKDLMANFNYLNNKSSSLPSTMTTVSVVVVDNGVFKTGSFYIDGVLADV